jgi:predicted dehydrogenase
MKRLKVGVIGCGVMGSFHIKQLKEIAEVELIGVSDQDPNRKPEGIKFYNDYIELLKDIDAVTIATPTFTHYDVANAAIDMGKHVFIEKPIAVTAEQGRTLTKKALSKKITLAVGFIERFNPAYVALRKALGRGKPDLIDIRRLSPFPARINDVSCVIDMMIHDIDLAIKLAGADIRYINATGNKVKTAMLDNAYAVIVFTNGTIANIEASRVHNDKVRNVIVASGKSIYDADLLNKTAKVKTEGRLKELQVEKVDQLNLELRDFINAITKNAKPSVSGRDGVVALEVANTIEELALKS